MVYLTIDSIYVYQLMFNKDGVESGLCSNFTASFRGGS